MLICGACKNESIELVEDDISHEEGCVHRYYLRCRVCGLSIELEDLFGEPINCECDEPTMNHSTKHGQTRLI